MGFWSSLPNWFFLLLVLPLLFIVGQVEASPSWSTYHGQTIQEVLVSDTGVTFGLTEKGAVFLLARDSSFIASWSREEAHSLGALSLSKDGEYAALCYEDGYTALFTHDGQEGRYLWAYTISNANPSTLALHSSGTHLGIATTLSYEEGGREYQERSTIYLFSQEGRDIWRRVVDSSVTSMSIHEEQMVVVGGSRYQTPLGERGRDAIYLYDERGDLIWDKKLDARVKKVEFTTNGLLVLVEGHHFYHYSLEGELLWDRVEEVHVAHFSSSGYVAGFYQNKVFLFTPEGERAWVHGIDGVDAIALSDTGHVAVKTHQDITLWNEEGVEVLYYSPREEIYSLGISQNGGFLVLGLNKVSMFVLP